MYKVIDSLEELYQEIEIDKNWTGAEYAHRNRYPLRFVLFENFSDFYAFVDECSNHSVHIQGMSDWMEADNDDQLMTYSELAKKFAEYIKHLPSHDFVIAPFSEITRFYDNEQYKEFDSVVTTIRLISAPEEAQADHQRIYIPIIGMQSKMNHFKNDPNINIWEYRSGKDVPKYKLILSRGKTYGVQSLEQSFTVCENMRDWIALWKVGNKVKDKILCTSKTLFDNAANARPDNAFDYVVCNNVFDFLTDGHGIDFGSLQFRNEELQYWEELASNVDALEFDFKTYVNKTFNSYSLNDEKDFVHIWFEYSDGYSRWLLKNYYLLNHVNTYLSRVLTVCRSQSTSELFSLLATVIFDEQLNDEALKGRAVMLAEASSRGVEITQNAEVSICDKLKAIAFDSEKGYQYAMKYMTPLTMSERKLMIEWLGAGVISRSDVRDLYPDLYSYTSDSSLNVDVDNAWINTYFTQYRKSKISNHPTASIVELISLKNTSSTAFEMWYNSFKTVKTILHNRSDIDVYYWIDGLGVDWIPFITDVIRQHQVDGVYLNEVYVGVAELPSTTAVNKEKLESISYPNELKKIGDLDSFAHKHKVYPDYINDEFDIVREAISSVLAKYNGKKIAFVSDHGISYLSQYGSGLNMAGIDSNHAGRCGRWVDGYAPSDASYLVLEDGKKMCSLTYDSLSSKTPVGLGAHGGATPEEVLVPVIIVSNKKNASSYSASLMDSVISAASPVVRYHIKGLSTVDVPYVEYNGVEYILRNIGNCLYESERINLVATSTKIALRINNFIQHDSLVINTGVEEEDLFGGF